MEEVKNYYAGRHLISMEEDIVLVCRKSKISMQEGREVEGKSVIRISSNIVDYCEHLSLLDKILNFLQ